MTTKKTTRTMLIGLLLSLLAWVQVAVAQDGVGAGGVPGYEAPTLGQTPPVGSNTSGQPTNSGGYLPPYNSQYGTNFGGGVSGGRNFGSLSGPNGSIAIGRNFFATGTGNSGGIGGYYHPYIDAAACRVLGLPEGSFGALMMIAAGLVAIVAGALGAYKAALSTIAIGAGAWILRPIVAMFFPISCGGIF